MRLSEYLDRFRSAPFEWGVNDCFIFTNGWVSLSGATPFIRDQAKSYKNEKSAQRTYLQECKRLGVKNLEQFFDAIYTRVNCVPPDGSVVARVQNETSLGFVLGIVEGRSSIFMGLNGLEFLPISPDQETYWKLP